MKSILVEDLSSLYSEHGIPAEHTGLFLDIAEEYDVVILTRTPGEACGQLLKQGYDAKSFWVKSKSCNWGPMAGFVCLDPLLNKSKRKGALDNALEAYKSLSKVYETVTKDNGTKVAKKSIAIQICINTKRLNWLKKRNENAKNKFKIVELTAPDGTLQGYIFKSDELDVLLKKKSDDLYAMYYDIIKLYNVTRISKERLYNSFMKKLEDYASTVEGTKDGEKYIKKLNDKENRNKIGEFWELIEEKGYLNDGELDNFRNGNYENYVPLMAMTNAHRPYRKDSPMYHLNALTGDYDLFAVWPRKIDKELDRRVAGMFKGLDNKELIKREESNPIGKVVGNITERIYFLGQVFNSRLPKNPEAPAGVNRVYHSDEGGRPFVSEVDSAIGFGPDGKVFEIKDAEDLSKAIIYYGRPENKKGIKYGYKCFVNQGWRAKLIGDAPEYARDSESLLNN